MEKSRKTQINRCIEPGVNAMFFRYLRVKVYIHLENLTLAFRKNNGGQSSEVLI